jgi:hypothetical protein
VFLSKTRKSFRCSDCQRVANKSYSKAFYEKVKRGERKKQTFTHQEELFFGAKRRSAEYPDQIFDLHIDDIVIPEICPILKTPFIKGTSSAASVDRIDSSKGYCKGNIQIISRKANLMKSNATQEELEKFAHWVLNNKKDKKLNEKQIEDYVTEELEELTFEELLEVHDLTPQEVFILLFNHGHIDSDTLEEQMKVYNR